MRHTKKMTLNMTQRLTVTSLRVGSITTIRPLTSVDTSKRIDNTLVSDVTTELIKLAVSNIRKIHPPDVKLCEVCEENPATAVIRPTLSSFDESLKTTVPTTCKNCAMKDDMNDYVLDLAKCGHARPRYKNYLDCQECVVGRQQNNILTREELCRACNEPLNLDNINSTYSGLICRACKMKGIKDLKLNHKYDVNVECDDCGGTYKKQIQKTKSIRTNSMCVNHLQEVNAMCRVICQNTMEIGGIMMRCRSKRYTVRRGDKDVVNSKFCGKGNKCKSLSQNNECWFVCRKTPENLTMCEDVSSKNYVGDLKMAAA